MNYVKMNKAGNYRGKKYIIGTILCVGVDLANRIISNGQGSKSTKEAFETQDVKEVKETDELKAVDYKSLNREPLEEFAVAIGIEKDAAKGANKKEDLIVLIESKLKEEE